MKHIYEWFDFIPAVHVNLNYIQLLFNIMRQVEFNTCVLCYKWKKSCQDVNTKFSFPFYPPNTVGTWDSSI